MGSVITSHFLHSRLLPRQQANAQLGLARLKKELNLTPDQERFVTKELDDYAKYYQNIEEEREDVSEHGKRRILGILNPAQRKRFLELFQSSPLPTGAESLH